ncbi:MAG TPA: amidohydrolase family protein [Flavobacteriales bacterium]|nr:amidohydrolase [Flavobacteriales bacterium]HRE73528.1 amidohydrolase family protein [Flavobacteriales bacterium]HRE98434.1 amidohydrolase family protein [Flavobacteriales bacterium]HRJ36209.1 amidohydrolase family protein [Flavobacteriales bacterium]HRJ37338.1 amidohydrolase family protein [Flavobacteriales bacterium]
MKKIFSLFVFLLFAFGANAKEYKSVLLMNGTAHLGTGEVITHSLVGIRDGKIVLVANALITNPNKSEYDTVINIEGKHVYPGFIATDVTLGLIEIESVRATADFAEVGAYNPNVRAVVAYNTDSKVIPTVRSNGVLISQIVPRGGVLSGTSSIMRLQGWNWEDAALQNEDGVHMNWPRFFQNTGWWAEPGETKANDRYQERLDEMKKFFREAKAYAEVKEHERIDVRFEAMRGLFDGTKNLYIHASFVKEITDAVFFCRDLKITKIVIVGGYDSWMVAEMLKENKVSVILQRVHELPSRPEDDIDLPYKLPALLHKAGVLFCLGNEGDQEAHRTRNLPFLAGTACAYGLDKEIALMAVTLNAARILGVSDRIGSLAQGKEATLFVSEGDALDMRTNKVTMAWIQGKAVDLNDHQKELYKRFSDKYRK